MKRFALAVAAASVLMTSGCTPILKEVRYPGGYPGYLLDRHTFNASGSKQLLLLRATIILAMAAEMSRVTVKGDDGDAFAKHLAAASAEINFAAADLYPGVDDKKQPGNVCDLDVTAPNGQIDAAHGFQTISETNEGCTGYYANFEGDVPLIEARIVKVLLAALPTDRARKFLNDAAKGNVLGAAWNAVSTVAAGVGGLHFAMARYRSGEELAAGSLGDHCIGSNALLTNGKFSARTMTVIEAAECLGLSPTAVFAPTKPEDRLKLRGGDAGQIKPGAFFVLMRSIASACVDLPYTGDVAAIAASRNLRGQSCNSIGFTPTARPYRIDPKAEKLASPAEASVPAAAPAPLPTPTPSPVPPPPGS